MRHRDSMPSSSVRARGFVDNASALPTTPPAQQQHARGLIIYDGANSLAMRRREHSGEAIVGASGASLDEAIRQPS